MVIMGRRPALGRGPSRMRSGGFQTAVVFGSAGWRPPLLVLRERERLGAALLTIQFQTKNAYDLALRVGVFADAVSTANDDF
jgi:hypothetical protein